MPANPAAAPFDVVADDDEEEKRNVITIFVDEAAPQAIFCRG